MTHKLGLFAGRSALVTGASRGIGAAVACALANHGAFVFVNCRRDTGGADRVLTAIRDAGGSGEVAVADVSDPAQVEAMFDLVRRRRGGVDLLVNNAAVTRDGIATMMTLPDWDAVIKTDLTATFLTSRLAARAMMRSRRGSIVNIGSVSAATGRPGQINYAAAKAGVIALSRTLALELSEYGVRVNCVVPGFIETDMLSGLTLELRKKYLEFIPMRRFGRVDEVAQAVIFLLSDAASFIQGQTLIVDGGMIH